MTRYFLRSIVLLPIILALFGCGSGEETYEAAMLPSHIKSAVLRIKDGKGQLTIQYPNQVFLAEGKIEEIAAPRSFALVRDSSDDQFMKYEFIWRLEINAWLCPECIKSFGPGFAGDSSVLWVKK